MSVVCLNWRKGNTAEILRSTETLILGEQASREARKGEERKLSNIINNWTTRKKGTTES